MSSAEPSIKLRSRGNRNCSISRNDNLLCKTTEAECGEKPVARIPAADPLPSLHYFAGDFSARRERALRLQLIFVLDDENVRKIDCAGADPDE